jgi:hypothetical protein
MYVFDREGMLKSLDRLSALESNGARIFFGHDPDFWRTVPQARTSSSVSRLISGFFSCSKGRGGFALTGARSCAAHLSRGSAVDLGEHCIEAT